MRALVGVDVGATSISGGLVNAAGDVVAVEQRATHARGKGTAVEMLLEVVEAALAEARARAHRGWHRDRPPRGRRRGDGVDG
jgi:predicted NBD/HSP70 family sugar kinase